jgi:hypothetical protein
VLRLADIPSARAEKALYRANEVLAGFRSDVSRWPLGSREGNELAQDALLRLVTIAEMFAGEHLVEVAELRLPTDDLVFRIWDERIPRIVRDWESRKSSWKDIFELDWTYGQWSELLGFITARNIIAHGMGQLTRSQIRRGQIDVRVTKKLGAAKLTLRGNELQLSENDVERCGLRVRHFIEWLDEESRTASFP